MTDAQGLRIGHGATIGWGLALIAPATIFRSDEGSIVMLVLGVAGITSGGLLGAFVSGTVNKRARALGTNIAFVVAVVVNPFFFVMEKYVPGEVGAWQWVPAAGLHRHVRGRWTAVAAARGAGAGRADRACHARRSVRRAACERAMPRVARNRKSPVTRADKRDAIRRRQASGDDEGGRDELPTVHLTACTCVGVSREDGRA